MKLIPLAEKACLIAVLMGAILLYLQGAPTMTNWFLLALSGIFFLYSFQKKEFPIEENEKFGFSELLGLTIVPKVIWIGCSVSTLGIAFYLFDFGNDGFMQMLLIGASSIATASVLLIVFYLQGTRHIKMVMPVLIRAIPLCIIDIYLFVESL